MASSRVHLERPSELANDFRTCRFLVDGRSRGTVPVERSRAYVLPAGEHRLTVELGGRETNALELTLAPDEDAVLGCGSPKFVPFDVAEVLGELRRPFLLWPSFDLALAWFARGAELRRKGELDHARTAYERGAQLRPHDPLGHLRVAALANRQGEHWAARAAAERALALAPEHVDARLERARAAGAPAERLLALEQVHAVDPAHAVAHHERALALVALGRREEALAALERAVGRTGVPDDARRLRRRLNAELGRRDPSDEHFGRLFLDAYRRQAKGYDGLGYDYIKRIAALDRAGFVRFVTGARFGRLTERELAAFEDASPERVAELFRGRLLEFHGPGGGGVPTSPDALWFGLLLYLAGVRRSGGNAILPRHPGEPRQWSRRSTGTTTARAERAASDPTPSSRARTSPSGRR